MSEGEKSSLQAVAARNTWDFVPLNGKGYNFVCSLAACMKCNWKLGWVVLRVLLIHVFKESELFSCMDSFKEEEW